MWNFITNAVVFYAFYRFFILEIIHIFRKRYDNTQSHTFNIDYGNALYKNKKYLEMIGIKSGAQGKDYELWTKDEKEKIETNCSLGSLNITYLAKDNAFFIAPEGKAGYFYLEERNENAVIYSEIIAGDKDRFEENMEFGIYKIYKKIGGIFKHCALVPYFRYKKEKDSFQNGKFTSICEFPYMPLISDNQYKKLGFDVDKTSSDIWIDDFGEYNSYPAMKTYRKNGISFKFVFF